MLKRFLSYYKPQMGLFVADTVCALVLAAIDLAFPIILRNLTGGLFTQGQAAIMQALGMIAGGLVLMYAVRCACRYFVSYLSLFGLVFPSPRPLPLLCELLGSRDGRAHGVQDARGPVRPV